MRSIALYYRDHDLNSVSNDEEKNKVSNINSEKLDFHINIWKVETGHYCLKPNLYFDFGIRAKFKIDKLCLYLPFEIETSEFKDLGIILHNQRALLSTVFNDDVSTKTLSNDCYCEVQLSDNRDDKFYLYQLGNNNIKIDDFIEEGNTKGTFIELTINGTPDNSELKYEDDFYVRFRVKVKDMKQVVITQHLSNDLLQAAFSMADLYDIRINELREVHPKVSEMMKTKEYKICSFSKIHIFYMADIHEVIENGSSLKRDSRILEDKKWCSYMPKTDLHNSIFIAHHWKRRDKNNENDNIIKSFSLFFSTVYPRTQILRLIVYIMVVVILGFLGSMFSFTFDEINLDNHSTWTKPIIALFIILFIIVYIINSNFGFKIGNIFRKR